MRSLFEAPTVARLGQRIGEARKGAQALQTPPLQAIARDQDLPLSFAQERLWFLDQLEPGSTTYNLDGAVRLSGLYARTFWSECWVRLSDGMKLCGHRFVAVDGEPSQVIVPASSWGLEFIELRALSEIEREAEVRRLAFEHAQRPV